MKRRLTLGLLAFVTILLLTSLAAAASAPTLGPMRIVFSRQLANGSWNLFSMRADGSGQHRISGYHGEDINGSWSHDRKKIVFERGSASILHALYTMNADGSNVTPISPVGPLWRSDPDWSPVANRIAYDMRGLDTTGGIYVMNAGGGSETQLVPGRAENPDWSPDGKRIVFQYRVNKYEKSIVPGLAPGDYLFIVNADGTGLTRIRTPRDQPAAQIEPAWSPDGTRIAFACAADTCAGIYTMKPNGSGLVQISKDGQGPSWSPNGQWIALTAPDPNPKRPFDEIFIYKADGSGSNKQLTMSRSDNFYPDWR